MSFLYKTVRLQSIRFIILGTICLFLFGAVAIYVSPAIIAKFVKTPDINPINLPIDEKYHLDFNNHNTFRPYQMTFSNLIAIPPTDKNATSQYWLGGLESIESSNNAPSALLIRSDIAENLQNSHPFNAYIQPKGFLLINSKEEDELKSMISYVMAFNKDITLNPHWIITTEEKSDAFGFAIFTLILTLIPLLLLLHGGKLFLMPDRARELRYQRKHYFEDIDALSQDFDFEIEHKMVIKLKNAIIFQDFIVVQEAFRFYLIPIASLSMLYPTRKFVFYSLLWFIPKTGINVYEEERAYFVKLPAKSIQAIMDHLKTHYPYIERQKSTQHLQHAKNPEKVWQALITRKAQYEAAEKKDQYYA